MTPIPGPFGTVFGSRLARVSLQIVAGSRRVWLCHHQRAPVFACGVRS
ncbi:MULTISPECIES: hypothetical protein [unclassified Mesorhizobium]